jgi:hypothetical protein
MTTSHQRSISTYSKAMRSISYNRAASNIGKKSSTLKSCYTSNCAIVEKPATAETKETIGTSATHEKKKKDDFLSLINVRLVSD